MALPPVSYGIESQGVSPFKDASKPGFFGEVGASWMLGTVPQVLGRGREILLNEAEPGFNPWDHLQGYELYADTLAFTRSSAEMAQVKRRIDANNQRRELLARGEWGWMASLSAGIADPINLIPVPGSVGIGFLRGAAKAAVANTAIAAVTEPLRIGSDPTASWDEMAYSLGGAALFGAMLGGPAGRIRMKREEMIASRKAFKRMVDELNAAEGMNVSRSFNAGEEGYTLAHGNTRAVDEDGAYMPVKIDTLDEIVRTKEGPDGQLYYYDDSFGWVLEADRGAKAPRAVAPEIADALGMPEKTTVNRMVVDDVALRNDFETGKVDRDFEPGTFRNADEYVTFRQIEAVWRKREPIKPDETREQFRSRIREEALKEIVAGRASSSVARTKALAGIIGVVDRLNLSPVAKAVRLYANDAKLTDLPLQIAGDYGWAVRANQFGYKTPPSVLVRAMRHNAAAVEIKQALDQAWVKFVQGGKATGATVLGHNVTAGMEGLRARVQSMAGRKVMTRQIFNRMAGRAVFEPEAFEIDGFTVPPEAREAAKAWTRIAQRYDAEARELGIFYDQTALKRTVGQTEERMVRLKDRMVRWLWGGTSEPSGLMAAVKVGDKIFTGETHADALRAATEVLDEKDLAGLSIDSYGYVDKPRPSEMDDPVTLDWVRKEEERFAAFIEANQEEYDRLQQMEAAGAVDLEAVRNARAMMEQKLQQWWAEAQMDRPANDNIDLPPAAPAPAPKPRKFRSAESLVADRINSLSEGARVRYDDLAAQLAELQQRHDAAKAQLEQMSSEPHRFTNQFGKPEPFFARYWDHMAVLDKRDAFKRLLTAWYKRDNPLGAEERADKTIDRMLSANTNHDEDTSVPGLRHLHKRTLDMPNSFKIVDPELGEIRAADFFENDLETVSEAYIRGMGTKIETARMFGDTSLWQKMDDIKNHFFDSYISKASDGELSKAIAKRNEYLGWVELTRDAVLGGLKTRDPWAIDNRIARNMKNWQTVSQLGSVLYSVAAEAMRPFMVNGFAVGFQTLWARLFSDMERMKGSIDFSRETGEVIAELVLDRAHQRIADFNTPEPGGGGTVIEKWLERTMPSFFKISGLSHWTAMAKDWVALGTQHKIMQMVRDYDAGNNAVKLGALGISKRDARLIASMPVDEYRGLTLPAVDRWAGADGRRARSLVLDALTGEIRRAIVTPSIADKSLAFSGVLAHRGRKVAESEAISVPLQFLSFGIAANQKVLLSAMQGRDQSTIMGVLAMMAMATMVAYLKAPENARRNKDVRDYLLEGYEASGIGGFWFGDINRQIERFGYGVRPALGMDPPFGKTAAGTEAYADTLGPAPGTIYDLSRVYWDDSISATQKAQLIRRAIPYNNIIWWAGVTRDLASDAGRAME